MNRVRQDRAMSRCDALEIVGFPPGAARDSPASFVA